MSTLRTEQLESRDCPAAVPLGNGELLLDSGVHSHPFEDWQGGYATLVTPAGNTFVGGVDGAGPRIAVLRPDGTRDRPDYFAPGMDPASRFGVVFVDTSDDPYTPPEPVTVGSGAVVFLDGATAEQTNEVAAYFGPMLDVLSFTNGLPSHTPPNLTVRFNTPSEWLTSLSPGAVGMSESIGALTRLPPDPFRPLEAWVSSNVNGQLAALDAAHEVGHNLGLDHDTTNIANVMFPRLTALSATFDARQFVTMRTSLHALTGGH